MAIIVHKGWCVYMSEWNSTHFFEEVPCSCGKGKTVLRKSRLDDHTFITEKISTTCPDNCDHVSVSQEWVPLKE